MNTPVELLYFSDILCVWAYAGQIRLDELRRNFGDQVRIRHRFIAVFGNTEQRIGAAWKERGGYAAYAEQVREVARQFPHVRVSPDTWTRCVPRTSMTAHLFIKALQRLEAAGSLPAASGEAQTPVVEQFIWRARCAFFEQAQDIGSLPVLFDLAAEMGLPRDPVKALLDDGTALADLAWDMEQKERLRLEGSPSYVLNEGRQKLYGNVGYRVLEANIRELLEHPGGQASWC